MGTFDSFYDRDGYEYQTKAFGAGLGRFHVGDRVPRTRTRACTAREFDAELAGTRDDDNGLRTDTFQAVTTGVADPAEAAAEARRLEEAMRRLFPGATPVEAQPAGQPDPRTPGPRWINVVDGIFVGITATRDASVPEVSYLGYVTGGEADCADAAVDTASSSPTAPGARPRPRRPRLRVVRDSELPPS